MRAFVNELTSSAMFGLTLTCLAYLLCIELKKRWNSPIFNPLIFALLAICLFLTVTGIPLENYRAGGDLIQAMLGPVTAVLAVTVYRRLGTLKRLWLPVLSGCVAGALTAVGVTAALCRLFGLDREMTLTLLPKSVTGAFAVAVSEMIGGIPSITMACVSLTGMIGFLCSTYLLKGLRMRHPAATGVCLGTSCHALGTVRAMELGEEQAAMSSLAMCLSGVVMTVVGMLLR